MLQNFSTHRVIAIAFLSGVALGAGGGIASAYGPVDSSNGSYTVAGREYINSARIITENGFAQGSSAATQRGGNTPAGYAGARGRLFNGDNNQLYCEGTIAYNTAGQSVRGNSCTPTGLPNRNWYSYGVTQAYNGSGYQNFFTNRTTNQTS